MKDVKKVTYRRELCNRLSGPMDLKHCGTLVFDTDQSLFLVALEIIDLS